MKKWKIRVNELLNTLGLTSKVKDSTMAAEDWSNFMSKYQETYGISFEEDRQLDEDEAKPSLSAELVSDIANALSVNVEQVPQDTGKALKNLVSTVKDQKETINKLANEPESTQTPSVQMTSNVNALDKVLGRTAHTATNLFGIESKEFSRSNWWVELTASRKANESKNNDDLSSFKDAFSSECRELSSRVQDLSTKNLLSSLNFKDLTSGNGIIDYSDLQGKAGEYKVRRQDAIIAYLKELPSVSHLFDVISNVQNKEDAATATFGELSQSYLEGRVFKGNTSFSAEVYKVDDMMFKFMFTDMIQLEKQYIGYLNKEGSDVIKWTFIEWIIIHFVKILNNEQQRRRVVGVCVPRQSVIANPAMLGADGVLRAIERAEEELKVLPYGELGVYTEATIIDYFETFWGNVEQCVPSMQGFSLYINEKHKRMYVRAFRERYGKDNDFTGVRDGLIDVSPESIVWVPNMESNCYKSWIAEKGNICNLENKPGEMSSFYFERDFEAILVMSRWKEGSVVLAPGAAYKTLADLIASERRNQLIFTNDPATSLSADATVIDAKMNNLFKTGQNTQATKITNITNYSKERVYKIVCGSTSNATSIDKSGKFAKISAAWTPTAIGDYIKVYAELEDYTETINGKSVKCTRPTGNFLELERKVTA